MARERDFLFSEPETATATDLASGGFAGDTEVMTTLGPQVISELSIDDVVLALNPTTRILKSKPVVQVQKDDDIDQTVTIDTQRSNLRVLPDHRMVYTTKSISSPRFMRAGDLDGRSELRFLNDWHNRSGTHLEAADVTDLVNEYEICAATTDHGHTFRAALPEGCDPCRRNSHVGYYFDPETFKEFQTAIEATADETTIHAGPHCWRRPYLFDGDDFIEFLGWFISEGSVHWPSSSDSAEVKLAQEDKEQRPKIAALLDRMDLTINVTDRAFSFSSTLYGELFEELCGDGSHNKRIPEFIWNRSLDQKQLLLETLVAGDGNERQTYYTASDDLAGDVLRLMLELGMKPRYTQRGDCWQIFMHTTNDGFRPPDHVSTVETNMPFYRLTIQDFSLIMAGREGKFQWVGVSGVA